MSICTGCKKEGKCAHKWGGEVRVCALREPFPSAAVTALPDDNELGVRILDFLREIHEREETPESIDVDDLYALISQYMD